MTRFRIAVAVAGLVGLIGGMFAPAALLQAWHIAVVGCIEVALGFVFLLLLFRTTGGRWGEQIKPVLAGAVPLLPFVFLALIPVLIFLPTVYHWQAETGDRTIFLNRPFFTVRALLYLLAFSGLGLLVLRGRLPGAGGLIAFVLVGYFVAIDLVMAIDPEWYSSGFPVVFLSSCVLMGLSAAIMLRGDADYDAAETKPWRDLGGLLLAAIVFWSYVAFTEFLIIWMGNLSKEIEWYLVRGAGGWKWVTVFLAVFSLFAPFFLLLARAVKDHPRRLRRVAAMVFVGQVVYVHWLIAPSFAERGVAGFHWIDPFVLFCVYGILFGVLFKRREAVA